MFTKNKKIIENIYTKILSIKWFQKKRKNPVFFLNSAQFFGVINDNLFKLLIVFLFIDYLGPNKSTFILSTAGAVYVLPFLLFSSLGGAFADRFSKHKILITLKAAEILIMIFAIGAFYIKSITGCYVLLFLLATHSALFGPSKYGIIPELVSKENLTKANALITSFTYMAMIVGTFLASFLTDLTHKKFVIALLSCVIFSIMGFLSSLGIPHTAAQNNKKKDRGFFLKEILNTLKFSKSIPYLYATIFASAFFLFIGAFIQLNIIPYAIQNLHRSEVAGGYLFFIISLGMAFGSYLCGRWMKTKCDLGVSCAMGFLFSFCILILGICSPSLSATVICLIILGITAGIFIIPLTTYLQMGSPKEKRGEVIACNAFFSFLGVLVAAGALYLLNDILSLSPAISFITIGLITFLFNVYLSLKLAGVFLPFISKKIILRWHKIDKKISEPFIKENCLLIIEKASIEKALCILGLVPETMLILPKSPNHPKWISYLQNVKCVEGSFSQKEWIEKGKSFLKTNTHPCLLLAEELDSSNIEKPSFKGLIFKEKVYVLRFRRNERNKWEIQFERI
ncbi:MAG: MFS transporter [Chlamydiae bacterium]|nr:MFS transporter [Chlamydiota bacterium]